MAEAGDVPVLRFPVIDSTNAEARRRAEAGETGPLWIVADAQTAGRGRRGRAWDTATGNLAATWLGHLDRPPVEAAQLAFVAGLAVAELVDRYVPPSLVRLKWPNDTLLAGRKVSGVLIESGAAPGGGLWIACGVGVNLRTAPTAVERPASAIIDHLAGDCTDPPSPEAALDTLAAAFARWLVLWSNEGFEPIRTAWTARAAGLGQPCEARLGSETISGVAEALESDGALRLRLPNGDVRRITAGEVFFDQSLPSWGGQPARSVGEGGGWSGEPHPGVLRTPVPPQAGRD